MAVASFLSRFSAATAVRCRSRGRLDFLAKPRRGGSRLCGLPPPRPGAPSRVAEKPPDQPSGSRRCSGGSRPAGLRRGGGAACHGTGEIRAAEGRRTRSRAVCDPARVRRSFSRRLARDKVAIVAACGRGLGRVADGSQRAVARWGDRSASADARHGAGRFGRRDDTERQCACGRAVPAVDARPLRRRPRAGAGGIQRRSNRGGAGARGAAGREPPLCREGRRSGLGSHRLRLRRSRAEAGDRAFCGR